MQKPRKISARFLVNLLIPFVVCSCTAPTIRYYIWDCEPGVPLDRCAFRGPEEKLDLSQRDANNLVCKTMADEQALIRYIKNLGAPIEGLDGVFGIHSGEDVEAQP